MRRFVWVLALCGCSVPSVTPGQCMKRAQAYYELAEFDHALDWAGKALELDPDNRDARDLVDRIAELRSARDDGFV